MNLKRGLLVASFLVFILGGAVYVSALQEEDSTSNRKPANVPKGYESSTACDKQAILWRLIENSEYVELPELKELGIRQLIKMGNQKLTDKGYYRSDFSPTGWIKYLHRHGTVAKVKIVPIPGTRYTGAFQGADCALLRLSLTYNTKGSRAVAPGLALKVFRDGIPSGNISALVSLDGQNKDFNFFKRAMSNIVPIVNKFGQKWVHRIFAKVARFPEELLTEELSELESTGHTVDNPYSPRQIFFTPGPEVSTPSEEHDVRESIARIPAGVVIYKIFAAPENLRSYDYANNYTDKEVESFKSQSIHIADVVTTSQFVASEFGDEGIFFRHQLKY